MKSSFMHPEKTSVFDKLMTDNIIKKVESDMKEVFESPLEMAPRGTVDSEGNLHVISYDFVRRS